MGGIFGGVLSGIFGTDKESMAERELLAQQQPRSYTWRTRRYGWWALAAFLFSSSAMASGSQSGFVAYGMARSPTISKENPSVSSTSSRVFQPLALARYSPPSRITPTMTNPVQVQRPASSNDTDISPEDAALNADIQKLQHADRVREWCAGITVIALLLFAVGRWLATWRGRSS